MDHFEIQKAIRTLQAFRRQLLEIGIQHRGSYPKYVELHRKISAMIGNVDGWIKRLADLPPTEPEIIRCKDCKWFDNIGCAIKIVDDSDKPTEKDYCSFAERKRGKPMDKSEIIERLERIAGHAVHVVGEEPFVMSLDDGFAVREAIEILKQPDRPEGAWTEKQVMSVQESRAIMQWQSARCVKCGHYHTIPYLYNFHESNFCPHCGSRNGGKQNGSD